MLLGIGWKVWLGLVADGGHGCGVLCQCLIWTSIWVTLESRQGGDIVGIILILLLSLLKAPNGIVAYLSIA